MNEVDKEGVKGKPGEKRNEFVTVIGEGTLHSVSDTGSSSKLRLRHD